MGLSRRLFLVVAWRLRRDGFSGTALRRRSAMAQASAWEVVDLFAMTATVSFGGKDYRGSFWDMNAAGEVGGAFVVSDTKYSPTIWSPDGKANVSRAASSAAKCGRSTTTDRGRFGYLDVLGFESKVAYPSYTTPRAWKMVNRSNWKSWGMT